MAQEIERKFLVQDESWREGAKGVLLRQGYLSSNKDCTVRVRIAWNKAFLTMKGVNNGAVRTEFEYPIPVEDAARMLAELAEKPVLEKERYTVEHEGFIWEVDVFLGDNTGLVVAEIELPEENAIFSQPQWLGEEVTGDPRYYNSNLIKTPYSQW